MALNLIQGKQINVNLTGSFTGSFSGSLYGTSSWAVNATSASYASTASYSQNLQISGSINNVDYIDFNTSASVIQPTPGRLSWNDTDGTLDIGLKGGNVTLQIGQEEIIRVVNKTAGNLLEADYRVVRVRSVAEGGAQGQRLAVVLAQADNDTNSATTLGIVTENIDVNQEGFITLSGQVRKINTTGTLQGETWVDGDVLYLSPTTPGYLTNIKPQAPQHTVIVGYVEYAHANQGKIFVKVDNGYEIDELHNVRINTGSLTSGQLLVRSGSLWINSNQLTGSYGLTGSLQATSFTGSLFGTSSWATNTLTASFAPNYLPLTGGTINGDVILNGTASIAFLDVTYQSSSIIYSSGSNQFGDATNDTQTLIGTVRVSGSQQITGSLNVSQGITGSLFGTSSWATNSISSTYPLTVTGSTLRSTYVPGGVGGSTNGSIFIGNGAGNNATNAINSNFLGLQAGYQATNALYSNFLGTFAGYQATNANRSTFLGYVAGYQAASASYSTLLGYYAGSSYLQESNTTIPGIGSNNIIIGTNITLESGRRDSINLGAIIFATGSYSDVDSNVFSGSLGTGRVGINNPNPSYTLDVSGSINFTGDLYQNGTLFESGDTQKYMWYSIQIVNYVMKYTTSAVVNPQQGMGNSSVIDSILPYTYVDIIDQENNTTYTSLTFLDVTEIDTFISDNDIVYGKVIIYSNRNNTGNLRVGGVNLFSTQITQKGREGKVSSKRSYQVENVNPHGVDTYNALTASLVNTLVSECSNIVPNFSTNYVNQTQVEAIVAVVDPNAAYTYFSFAPMNKYKKRQFSRYYVGRKTAGIDVNGNEVTVSNPNQAKILGVAVYEWHNFTFEFRSFITNYGYSTQTVEKIGPSNAGGSMLNVYIVQTSDNCRALVVEPIGVDRILTPPSFDKISDVYFTPIIPDLTVYRKGNITQVATYENRVDEILGISTYLSPTLFSNFRVKTISEVDVINLYSDRTCDLFEKALKLDKLKYTNKKYINLTLLNNNYQKN